MGITQKRIGDLRHRMTFQTLSLTSDGQGGATRTWEDSFTVWGEIKPLSSYQKNFAEQLQKNVSHKVTVRYNTDTSGITTDMRFTYDSRTFEVKSPLTIDERKAYITFDANEGDAT